MSTITHALSIDLEDYFMVSAFEPFVPKSSWGQFESRIERNTNKVLSLLEEGGAKATFFTVGWVGEKYPALVRRIRSLGHEIASHGYHHQLIYDQTPDEFRADVRRTKQLLEDASGTAVVGYRAPSFSVVERTRWALQILKEEGYRYDASILPAAHARGGMKEFGRFPCSVNGLFEFPMSTFQMGKKRFPFSGGGYFRLFPYSIIRAGIRRCAAEHQPAVVYLHPWEFDPDQPRLSGSWKDRFKHYLNLRSTEPKFRRLLSDFRFGTVQDVLRQFPGFAPAESEAQLAERL